MDKLISLNFSVEIPSLNNEEWKVIAGWESYAVSNMGRVYSLRLFGIMKPQKTRKQTAHVKIRLSHLGRWKTIYVHQLVARQYISNPDNKPYINHLDGNPLNNSVSNLEWCTPKENTQHSYRMGFQIMPTNRARGEQRSKKLKIVDVVEILRLCTDESKSYSEIGRMFKVHRQTIIDIKSGKSWAHIPSLINAGIAISAPNDERSVATK